MILWYPASVLFVLFHLSQAAARVPHFNEYAVETMRLTKNLENADSINEPNTESKTLSGSVDVQLERKPVALDSKLFNNVMINSKLNIDSKAESRGKKHKVKKVLLPLLTFVVLKAMTVVPFLIGALALKAWNGLQLSLFAFIIASGLTIFQLCQKLAMDQNVPVILDHPPVARRSLDADVHGKAYAAYLQ
ncbi:uncharacterized protein LOC126746214 [Anthonomus grandis grandis]|uniref:uncharacterized protein LOC126746214 n=1 Tax=Anthonomus grandis grandis TaxID=2921223 RepID=UPI0021667F0F|nr:uncharacterized protein LOC126746214 [Anthonomus grandis grandis]